jgi:hypothetical protein
MILKRPLCPDRIRKPPAGFSWLDHRLVRDGYLELCSHPAAALYLFLVTVADARGLSYYSDASVMKRLFMDSATFDQARRDLVSIGLIAYQKPLYQVLALGGSFEPAPIVEIPDIPSAYRPTGKPSTQTSARPPSGRGGMQSVKKILKTIMEDPQ